MTTFDWLLIIACVAAFSCLAAVYLWDWWSGRKASREKEIPEELPEYRYPTLSDVKARHGRAVPPHGSLEDCKSRFQAPPNFTVEPKIPPTTYTRKRKRAPPKKTYVPDE